MRAIWMAALLTACAGGTTDDKDDTDVTDTDGGDTDDTDAGVTGATLSGTVEDADGTPLSTTDVRVQFCRGVACLTPTEAGDGSYTFEGLEAGPGSFEIVPLGDTTTLSTPFAPIMIGEDDVTLNVVVPDLDVAVTLPSTPTEVEVTDGLYITIQATDIEPESPLDPVATEIAAVDATDVALPVELEGTLVAMYYMAPFDYPATDDANITVRLDNDVWMLGDNEAELWVGDYFDAEWDKVGDLTVDGDSKLTTTGTLPRISTLVVIEKP